MPGRYNTRIISRTVPKIPRPPPTPHLEYLLFDCPTNPWVSLARERARVEEPHRQQNQNEGIVKAVRERD